MKEELHKICFYTVDKHVRDSLVSEEKAWLWSGWCSWVPGLMCVSVCSAWS